MLVSEFKTNNPPLLPSYLADADSINQYIVDLVSHARFVAEKIDELEHDGKHRQQRIYSFQITRFPNLKFSIRVPTRHHYRLENRGFQLAVSKYLENSTLIDNSYRFIN